MVDHINHNKPSILKRVLNKLGVIDLHTKVNCWFCNQDTYILPGTRYTVNQWLCNLCDNWNIRDQNGDIIDPTIFQQTENISPPKRASTMNNISSRDGCLCADCQRNQEIIYRLMSEYIPDETDPDYEYKCSSADDHKAELHRKYDVCDNCRKLITSVVAKRMEDLRLRNFTHTVNSTLQETVLPKRPSRSQYMTKGIIWNSIHIFTLLFIIYSTLYPPIGSVLDWLDMDQMVDIQDFIITSWQEGVDKHDMAQLLIHYPISIINSFRKTATCFFVMDYEYCAWNISDSLIWILLINIISMKAMDWHPNIKSTDYEKVKNWKGYKKLQLVLLSIRLFIIYMVTLTSDVRVIWSIMIVYVSILAASIRMVKINGIPYVKKELKNSFIREDSTPHDTIMTEADTEMSVPSQPIDPIENIANGINRIRVQ